jgi:hypothetical protein
MVNPVLSQDKLSGNLNGLGSDEQNMSPNSKIGQGILQSSNDGIFVDQQFSQQPGLMPRSGIVKNPNMRAGVSSQNKNVLPPRREKP